MDPNKLNQNMPMATGPSICTRRVIRRAAIRPSPFPCHRSRSHNQIYVLAFGHNYPQFTTFLALRPAMHLSGSEAHQAGNNLFNYRSMQHSFQNHGHQNTQKHSETKHVAVAVWAGGMENVYTV